MESMHASRWVASSLLTLSLLSLGGIRASALASDLIVTEVNTTALAHDCRTAAASGNVAVTVENVGGTPTGAGFNVVLFEDQNGNGGYDSGVDLFLAQATVPGSLNPGDQATVNPAINATFLFSKNLVHAFADSDNDIAESDETNNVADSGASCFFAPRPGSSIRSSNGRGHRHRTNPMLST